MMSPTQKYQEVLRRDLAAFSHRAFIELQGPGKYRHNWHLDLLAAKLIDVMEGRVRRLIVNIPPRHLKSHLVTTTFPAFILGHHPTKKIMCLSYAQDVSDAFARKCRSLMKSAFYQAVFDTRLSEDHQAIAHFETTEGGERISTSIGGVVTSKGADILIIDDPMKADEARSDTRRVSTNEWYNNTLRSRLDYQDEGAIIIVMQRLHIDDLVAHVQENEEWDVVSLPAIATEDVHYDIETPLGRRVHFRHEGDILQPNLMSRAALDSLRKGMTEYNFSAQYQQMPIAPGGNLIKSRWLGTYVRGQEPKFHHYFQSWDTANTSDELSAYSVCTTWGVADRNKYYLLDVYRERLDFPELMEAVLEQHKNWPLSTVIIEDAASGTQVIQEFRGHAIRIRAHKPAPRADKVMRLHVESIHFEQGRVFLPEQARWLNTYIAELIGFPQTKFADQVDSTTQFLAFVNAPGGMPMIITQEILDTVARHRHPRFGRHRPK